MVYKAAADAGYDTIIQIQPTGYDNERFMKPGYGLYKGSMMGLGHACAYALFNVHVIDAKTKTDLAWQWGFDSFNEGPCAADTVAWNDNVNQLTPAELAQIETAIKNKIAKGVVLSLQKFDLGNTAPAHP